VLQTANNLCLCQNMFMCFRQLTICVGVRTCLCASGR